VLSGEMFEDVEGRCPRKMSKNSMRRELRTYSMYSVTYSKKEEVKVDVEVEGQLQLVRTKTICLNALKFSVAYG
jgi:hypothetical protein